MNNILNHIRDKEYVQFEEIIQKELKSRLNNNSDIKDYISQYDKINSMKQSFSEISNIAEPDGE